MTLFPQDGMKRPMSLLKQLQISSKILNWYAWYNLSAHRLSSPTEETQLPPTPRSILKIISTEAILALNTQSYHNYASQKNVRILI